MEDDDDEAVAMIPITQREGRVLARILFDSRTDTVQDLTAEVATSLLTKLRNAHYEPR